MWVGSPRPWGRTPSRSCSGSCGRKWAGTQVLLHLGGPCPPPAPLPWGSPDHPAARPGQPDPGLHGRDPASPTAATWKAEAAWKGNRQGWGPPPTAPTTPSQDEAAPVGKHRRLAAEGWPRARTAHPHTATTRFLLCREPGCSASAPGFLPPQPGEHLLSPALCTALGSWTAGLHGRDPALGAQWGLGPCALHTPQEAHSSRRGLTPRHAGATVPE